MEMEIMKTSGLLNIAGTSVLSVTEKNSGTDEWDVASCTNWCM